MPVPGCTARSARGTTRRIRADRPGPVHELTDPCRQVLSHCEVTGNGSRRMSTNHDKVAGIFDAVVELASAAERAAYLDAACGQDRELRADVDELLQHDDEA